MVTLRMGDSTVRWRDEAAKDDRDMATSMAISSTAPLATQPNPEGSPWLDEN